MDKTGMMKRHEAETGEILDIDHLSADTNGSWYRYIEELEAELRGLMLLNRWLKEEKIQYQAKAEAYDRLMSGQAAMTLKEMANFIGRPVTVGRDGGVTAHGAMPRLETTLIGKFWYNDAYDYEEIPESFVEIPDGFDWTTSLTLPDGCGERIKEDRYGQD